VGAAVVVISLESVLAQYSFTQNSLIPKPQGVRQKKTWLWFALTIVLSLGQSAVMAAVLPEDVVETLYHRYSADEQTIDGPAVLVQKQIKDKYSIKYSHLVDQVSGASVDVQVYGSPYSETRTENKLSATWLIEKGTVSAGIRHSEENDFTGVSSYWQISQEVFSGMTTVSLGVSRGWDEVRRRGDTSFSEEVDRWQYRLALSQVLTPNLVSSMAFEAITDQGYLNNPYRLVRYLDPSTGSGFGRQSEVYPNTRTSYALSFFLKQYLSTPMPSAFGAHYRYFQDTWEIQAHQIKVDYTLPFADVWEFETALRWYSQDQAEFYNDLFPFRSAQRFLASDKELSEYDSVTLGIGVHYLLRLTDHKWLQQVKFSFMWDHLMIDYANFRDQTAGGAVGQEPLYNLDASIYRAFFTVKF